MDGQYHGKGLFKRKVKTTVKNELGGEDEVIKEQSYDGDWYYGDMSGIGKFTWPSGNVYEGEWMANRRHGVGKITDSKGVVRLAGTWQLGKYQTVGG